jgi:hypothetical protein
MREYVRTQRHSAAGSDEKNVVTAVTYEGLAGQMIGGQRGSS